LQSNVFIHNLRGKTVTLSIRLAQFGVCSNFRIFCFTVVRLNGIVRRQCWDGSRSCFYDWGETKLLCFKADQKITKLLVFRHFLFFSKFFILIGTVMVLMRLSATWRHCILGHWRVQVQSIFVLANAGISWWRSFWHRLGGSSCVFFSYS